MIVSVEDSRAISRLIQYSLSGRVPGIPFRSHTNLMSAVSDMRDAKGVIIDWYLDDGVDAESAGVLEFLEQKGIPHAIFTACPDRVPDTVKCPVFDKSEVSRLIDCVADWLP